MVSIAYPRKKQVIRGPIRGMDGPNAGFQALNTWAVLVLQLPLSTGSLLGWALFTKDPMMAKGGERVWGYYESAKQFWYLPRIQWVEVG